MGTLAIQASGFSVLPAQAPANWPAGITWPGAGSPNGTKSVTISDADWISLLTWTAATQFTPNLVTPITPTAPAILLAWVQIWINGTINSVQRFFTTPPVVPPAIGIN